ncbi:class I SAM-dependent methyltransferase [bacterium]|nr:class I SAM-dependent methyltransferase [bacterium]
MKIFTKRDCPLCSNGLTEEAISPDISPDDNIDKIGNYWRGFYKDKLFFPYNRCSCGLLYCKKYFDDKYLTKLYSNMDDNVYSGDVETDHITKDKYIDKITDIISEKNISSVIEIGADNGSILKKLRKKNPSIKKCIAVEPNKKMHDLLKNVSHSVYNDISEVPENDKFDLIICIHVLDHIPNISEYIIKISNMLNKKGYIFGVVHDESSGLAKILGKRWPAYCLQHPHLFNPKTIENLFSKINLEKISVYKTINSFKIGYLISQLILAIFKKNIKCPELFNVNLKLGNIGFIFKK